MRLNYVSLSLITGLLAISAVIIAIVTQEMWHLTPCPLCIFQRVAYLGVGIVLLVAALHRPKTKALQITYPLISIIFTLTGIILAARHLWLIHLPEAAKPSCGPGLNYLLETFPLMDVFKIVLHGSGDCAKIDHVMLGMTIPMWSLLGFCVLLILQGFIIKSIKHI